MLVLHGVEPRTERPEWPSDLRIFGTLCAAWGIVLICRVIFVSSSAVFQDVLFGVKFYSDTARLTMTIQAVIFATFGIAMLARLRWGLVFGLLYFAQVIIGHIIFLVMNIHVPDQVVHVKIASIEGPIMLVILLYFWTRARPLLRCAPA